MKKYRTAQRSFYFIITLLCILGIGIGHSVLSQRLTIDGVITYESLKWDVGFSNVSDGGGTVTSTTSISDDKKSITLSCNIGTSINSETCIVEATITNNSVFNVMLSETPTIEYNSTYIESVKMTWAKSGSSPVKFDGIKANSSERMSITITTKILERNMVPTEGLSSPITLELNWVEADGTENILEYAIGQEITIDTEKFNIISIDDTTVTMLAQYNLSRIYRQSTKSNIINMPIPSKYSNSKLPGPQDMDLQSVENEFKEYINKYKDYLQYRTEDQNLIVNFITLKELGNLGCTITADYSYTSNMTCKNSIHKDWLINRPDWFTRSFLSNDVDIWGVRDNGNLWKIETAESDMATVRPTVTISKSILDNFISRIPKQISELDLSPSYSNGTIYLNNSELNKAKNEGANLIIRIYDRYTPGEDSDMVVRFEQPASESFCFASKLEGTIYHKIVVYDMNNVYDGIYVVRDWSQSSSVPTNACTS